MTHARASLLTGTYLIEASVPEVGIDLLKSDQHRHRHASPQSAIALACLSSMATTTPDCRNWEDIILQKMKFAALTDEPTIAEPMIAPQTIVSHTGNAAEEEDEHGIAWMPAKPPGFHANGAFFCVRIQDCDISRFRLTDCFFQHVVYTVCEIDGLALQNCLFDNVIFANCSFHNVTLHDICLRNVVCRNVVFAEYTWTNEKVVDEELGPDSLKPVITGSRLGDSTPSDMAGVDWVTRASATAAAPAQSDEELARILHYELNGETVDTWNAWENTSGAWDNQPQSDTPINEDQEAGHSDWGNTAPVSTQWRDQTNQDNSAGPAGGSRMPQSAQSRTALVQYSDSGDDMQEAPQPQPKSAVASEIVAPASAAETKSRTTHTFGNKPSSAAYVNTSTLQDGEWVSEKPHSLYDAKLWKVERRYHRTFDAQFKPDWPAAPATSTNSTTTSHSAGSGATERMRMLPPMNQVSATDSADYRDPPHVRLAQKASESAGRNIARLGPSSPAAQGASTGHGKALTASTVRPAACASTEAPKKTSDANASMTFSCRKKDFYSR
ncbi:hypothetical protein EJ03DRAFT_217040 [Teratosphaeria nubilosa]|uniref:Uncharacterized protein n=1 Tax=Teratosphaeria nubilosa TaxID=161662 RepID=A0A6G1LI32_9PEZI|nr:hypothetical protein EJ03DRAFT_217040 [Teratosphaeria nubilosa]